MLQCPQVLSVARISAELIISPWAENLYKGIIIYILALKKIIKKTGKNLDLKGGIVEEKEKKREEKSGQK